MSRKESITVFSESVEGTIVRQIDNLLHPKTLLEFLLTFKKACVADYIRLKSQRNEELYRFDELLALLEETNDVDFIKIEVKENPFTFIGGEAEG